MCVYALISAVYSCGYNGRVIANAAAPPCFQQTKKSFNMTSLTTTLLPTLSPDAEQGEDYDLVVIVGGILAFAVVINALFMLLQNQGFEYVRLKFIAIQLRI